MYKIYIVEDDELIRNELTLYLSNYGYSVLSTDDFTNLVSAILESAPDLVLLDINLPNTDGYHVCRELRKQSNVGIIIVTSRNSEMDELMSMNLGADDFITKPYNTCILEAHIASVLRRTKGAAEVKILDYKGLELNLVSGTICYQNTSLELTKNELKLLTCLLQHKGQIVTRNDLIDFMWSSDVFIDDKNLSVNMTRLRKKLEQLGMKQSIETRRGLGYLLP